jgi:hypothetical protein
MIIRHLVFSSVTAAAVLSAPGLSSQTPAQARTQAIVVSFTKSKHVVKERHGVRVEKFKEIRSVPAVKSNPRDYSGSYEVPDMGFRLDLTVDANGRVSGSGANHRIGLDAQTLRTFTLADARLDGPLLTGTKVFANGSRERFEGVFINETTRDNPNDPGRTTFGLGAFVSPRQVGGQTVEKVFYQLKE